MAQRHLDPTAGPVPADALARYLRDRATEFLRALRLHREAGAGAAAPEDSVEAARALRRAARRVSAGLHTFQPVLDPEWAEAMRPELAWISATLALEDACASRLDRLLLALHRLSGAPPLSALPHPARTQPAGSRAAGAMGVPPLERGRERGRAGAGGTAPGGGAPSAPGGATPPRAPAALAAEAASTGPGAHGGRGAAATGVLPDSVDRTVVPAPDRGNLTVGAAKAGALLDRRLTLARTRAHSTALQALGSSRFHAIADKVAVLASEVPLSPAAARTDLRPLADAARERLTDAVAALPLLTAGSPYNAEALVHGLSPDPAPHPQDAPWHQVRLLLRLHRYALEVLHGGPDPGLRAAGEALDRHRDASEAAADAAQAARTPRIAPATAYALGVLHADQRHEVEAARYAFQRAWRKEAVGSS
ncbi:CHAD domain-containing protein [Streptomyces sp. NPDC126497]|uniref:CHAD domain-containing protein n=1 Tax=Streptomyces sp. NPDC126497 TaxID=3155313 RepID=UPI003331D745